ncbi:MAG TPA: shikimate dehydrogenase, partial [Oscillibacter sp.]|nr:shikimate dehydrogenase [Oscillibacter sp.]
RAARWALADRSVITAARRGGDVTMDELPQAARQCRVVVNATPLGMEGFPPFADLSFLDSLPAGAAVFDLIYAPRKTELYQAARARGLIAITG